MGAAEEAELNKVFSAQCGLAAIACGSAGHMKVWARVDVTKAGKRHSILFMSSRGAAAPVVLTSKGKE